MTAEEFQIPESSAKIEFGKNWPGLLSTPLAFSAMLSSSIEDGSEVDRMNHCWKTEQFHMLPLLPWYEKQEMLTQATVHGYGATEALLDDWIKKGLIGHAERMGLGRGQGSVAWWSSAQFTLFVEVLRARQEGKLRLGQLCALPIWRWLYWGEEGGVELAQVKRAMGTWAASVRKTTTECERKEARRGVEKLQGPGATGKLALIQELTEIGAFNKDPDPDVLRHLLEAVVTDSPFQKIGELPGSVFQPLAEKGRPLPNDIDLVVTLFPLRQRAFQQYEQQIGCLPDEVWQWARTFLLFLQFQGQRLQPRLAQVDPRFAQRYQRLTVYDVLFGACYDLLTPLSLAVAPTLLGKPFRRGGILPCLEYSHWAAGAASSQIETTVIESALLLPGGDPMLYLRNEVTIVYQEHNYTFTLDLPFL